jgi:hypothetical protein
MRPSSLIARRTRRFPHELTAAVVVFAIQLLHGTAASFVYDAGQYWAASVAIVEGGDAVEAGVLQLRGAISAVVYAPPAFVSQLLGPDSASWCVLVWNALLASALCVWLLPRMADLVTPGNRPLRIWISALVGGVVISGFARYPLLDVWAFGLALTSLLLLGSGSRWWTGVLAGFSLIVAANLRPAYLAPLLVAAVVLLLSRPRFVLWGAPGALLGLVPQAVLNLAVFGSFSVAPVQTGYLMTVQSTYATFTTRYDTVLAPDRYPSQFYCDPDYARLLIGDETPNGPLGVLISAAHHLPHSVWFLSQKASASLQWSFSTPYEHPPGPGTSLMAPAIVALSAGGLVALCWTAKKVWRDRTRRFAALAVLGFWSAALATLVLSTPETRFALPIVLIGLIGLLAVVPPDIRAVRPTRSTAVLVVVAVVLACGIFLIGKAGLQHPLGPGHVPDVASCAASDVASDG